MTTEQDVTTTFYDAYISPSRLLFSLVCWNMGYKITRFTNFIMSKMTWSRQWIRKNSQHDLPLFMMRKLACLGYFSLMFLLRHCLSSLIQLSQISSYQRWLEVINGSERTPTWPTTFYDAYISTSRLLFSLVFVETSPIFYNCHKSLHFLKMNWSREWIRKTPTWPITFFWHVN